MVALVVKRGPRGKPKAVAYAQFSQKMSFVAELAPINHRTNRAIAGERALALRILKIVSVGFQRIYIVDSEHPRNARCVFAIGRKKKSLKRGDGSKAAVKFPRPLAHVKAAHQKAIERKRRVKHILVDKSNVPIRPADLVRQKREANGRS